MVSALLLCAGKSRRMGNPKALLPFEGKTLIARAVEQLRKASVAEIICVTGADSQVIENEIQNLPVKIAYNPNYESGMLSSVQAGLRTVSPSSEGALITLVDLPYVRAEDFAILAAFAPPDLARFRYKGQHAHPVYIPRKFFAEILVTLPQQDGCAFLFRKYPHDVRWIEAESSRGLLDIDTAEDYHAHLSS